MFVLVNVSASAGSWGILQRCKYNATRPTFHTFILFLSKYVFCLFFFSFLFLFLPAASRTLEQMQTASDSVISIFPRNVLTQRNIGAGVCSSRLGLQSWGMVAFTPVKIILGEI